MADRTIPEGSRPPVAKPALRMPIGGKKVTPPNGFARNNGVNDIRGKARAAALKAKVLQGKNGTAHEQHLAHLQHMTNVKNNPKKYQ
jgi:hypothetical protein